jgi:ABC-type transport system substrate-binding protein
MRRRLPVAGTAEHTANLTGGAGNHIGLAPRFCKMLQAAAFGIALVLPPFEAGAADASKTLHVLLTESEAGMDPATASDASTLSVTENIFDPLLRYAYLARPLRLQPNTTNGMPQVSADRLTYTFRLVPGALFTPDAAFGGKPRELTARDYVYSIKRLYDPTLKSPWLFLFEHKLEGDDALLPEAGRRFDVDKPIVGLQALDRHTLQIRLQRPDNNLLFALATPATGAVAREVIEAHADNPGSHPVGTGPYRISLWQRNDRILLEANPGYRQTRFAETATGGADAPIAAALKDRQLPLIGRIDIKIMEEQQARVLGFLNREFDYLEPLPAPLTDMALTAGALKPALAARGIVLSTFASLRTFYLWMNMEDPVLGGYTPERIALRRAIGMAYRQAEDIRVLDHGMALPAQSPLPPDVLGYDPDYRSSLRYDPALAMKLLDHFGYRVRDGSGYRSQPDGRPLTLQMHTLASTTGRLRDEFWRRSLEAIGIRVTFRSDRFAEIIKASRLGTVQMFETNWIADFPDGENFFQLLYGPNIGRANYARFSLPAYDRLFEQARALPDSPERTALYGQMSRLIEGYAPWIVRTHPLEAALLHPWLRNYKRHPVENTVWRYLDIDEAARKADR